MAKIIILSGKICSGKTTYSEQLKSQINGVVLSSDEMVLSLFGEFLGDKHEEISERCNAYLYDLAEKIINANINVILDWSPWTVDGRKKMVGNIRAKNIDVEMRYIKVDEDKRNAQIQKRNQSVKEGKSNAYYICDNLKEKADKAFEEPSDDEDFILIDNSL